mmetsp:Transcript_27318/g.82336  ORF Transcript_27318/g.82336 Transcript_27318/m.82336 type:complete len:302 (-) Transcript_27318:746-1651(-)
MRRQDVVLRRVRGPAAPRCFGDGRRRRRDGQKHRVPAHGRPGRAPRPLGRVHRDGIIRSDAADAEASRERGRAAAERVRLHAHLLPVANRVLHGQLLPQRPHAEWGGRLHARGHVGRGGRDGPVRELRRRRLRRGHLRQGHERPGLDARSARAADLGLHRFAAGLQRLRRPRLLPRVSQRHELHGNAQRNKPRLRYDVPDRPNWQPHAALARRRPVEAVLRVRRPARAALPRAARAVARGRLRRPGPAADAELQRVARGQGGARGAEPAAVGARRVLAGAPLPHALGESAGRRRRRGRARG